MSAGSVTVRPFARERQHFSCPGDLAEITSRDRPCPAGCRHRRPQFVHPSAMTFSDHFSAFAARYAEFRPRYPAALTAQLAELSAEHDVAWDVGCGNGQLS